MKHSTWTNTFRGALLALVLVAGSEQVFGGDKGFEQINKEVAAAKKEIKEAEAKAADNRPDDAASKEKEDAYDDARRKNDDTSGDPKKDPAKKASQKAEDDAKKGTDENSEYHKALKERRDARKKLKQAIEDYNDLKKRQQKLSEGDPVNPEIEKVRKAIKDAGEKIAMGPTGLKGEEFAALVSTGKIKIGTSGTGETIGHIANLKIQNTTGQRISFVVPAMVLESGSGQYQHYACPKAQNVALEPHGEKTVPIDGVCLVRSKPPLGKDDQSDLICRDGKPGDHPQDSHLPAKDVNKLLRVVTSYYDAAEKLEKKGALNGLPYHDPKTRQEIVTQWGVWSDPQIAKSTGAPPATKEDLKTTIYKQAEKHGPVTPETKKKLDEGIDTIFQDIKLTTKEAKNLEKPDPAKDVEDKGGPPGPTVPPGPINVGDDTGKKAEAPKPTTQEKAPDQKPQKDEKPTDKSDKPETKDAGKAPLSLTLEQKPKAKKRMPIEKARDHRTPIEKARDHLEEENDKYHEAWKKYRAKHPDEPRRLQLVESEARLRRDIGGQREAADLKKELDDLGDKIHRDFDHSFEGEKLKGKIDEATRELKPLEDREKEMKKEMEKYGVKPGDAPDVKPKPSDEQPKPPGDKGVKP